MQLKGQDMAVKGGALAVAREILAIRRAEQQLNDPGPGRGPADAPEGVPAPRPPATNRVVEEWRRPHATGES
jgi:hypothetical protein